MLGNVSLEPIVYVLGFTAAAAVVWNFWTIMDAAYADYRKAYVAETEVSLGEVFSTFPAERVFQISLTLAGVIFLLMFLAINWIAGLMFAGGAFFAPRMYFNIQREKRRALMAEQLVDGLGLMASSLRAGLTLPQSMELVVREMKPPITQEFGRVLQENRLGTDIDEALQNMARRLESRDLDILVNGIAVTRRSGGNVGEIFQSIATTIRERFRIEGKVRALSSTANMQALVMSSMPFLLMIALFFLQKEYVILLFTTTAGLVAVTVVVILVVVAFLWIRWIMDIDI